MKRHHATLLKGIVSLALLTLIFLQFDPANIWYTIQAADLRYIFIGLAFSPIILLLKTIKWQVLVKQVAPVSLLATGFSLLAGIGIGLVTPGRVGELARFTYLPVTDKARFVGLVAIDRLIDLAAIVAAGAIAIALAFSIELAIGLLIPVALGMILLFIPGLPYKLANWLAETSFMPGKKQLQKLAQGLSVLNSRILFHVFFLAICTFLLGLYQFYWLLRSLGINAPLASAVSFPILTVAGVIPVTISGFGTREGAAILILSLYEVPEAISLNATLLSFIFNTFLPGILGLLIGPLTSKRSSIREQEPG